VIALHLAVLHLHYLSLLVIGIGIAPKNWLEPVVVISGGPTGGAGTSFFVLGF
jgi:hypothetical protein